MKIHIFNPEHDMAMAAGTACFTAPHAVRQLRYDLGFLPALWCENGDAVLVSDKQQASRSIGRIRSALRKIGVEPAKDINYIEESELKEYDGNTIDAWGWDMMLRQRLHDAGFGALPPLSYIEDIRKMSHRRISAQVLQHFQGFDVKECTSYDEVKSATDRLGTAILKMPWSSSGRGLRYIGESGPTLHQEGWIRNVIKKQGSIMVEPYYNKIMDFAMEFDIAKDNKANYKGLSVFYTENGQYRGNILATEAVKKSIITHYLPEECLNDIQQRICTILPVVLNGFQGLLGVDMMLIKRCGSNVEIHPCVEINLRRTIGHAALAISPLDDGYVKAMRIEFDGTRYKLKIVNVKRNINMFSDNTSID